MPRTYSTVPPAASRPGRETVEIGWEHTATADGGYELVVDDAGNPQVRSYELRTRFTHRQLVEAIDKARSKLDLAGLEADDRQLTASYELLVEVVAELVGRETITTIGQDPTVGIGEWQALINDLAADLGVYSLLGIKQGGGDGDPSS